MGVVARALKAGKAGRKPEDLLEGLSEMLMHISVQH